MQKTNKTTGSEAGEPVRQTGTDRVEWMRSHGVHEAEWSSTGDLLRCVLSQYQPGTIEPEREMTEEEKREAEKVAQAVIDRLTFGAS